MTGGLPSRPIGQFYPAHGRMQTPADVAVVMPTFGRPTIERAMESIYAQDHSGTIQIMIGIDAHDIDSQALIRATAERRPPNVSVMVVDMGYSTAKRRGGVHLNPYNGSLRAILGYMANSELVAFLDDDNKWAPDHLSSLLSVIPGYGWAYARRYFFDKRSGLSLCSDLWDSVGPHVGAVEGTVDGFVDPNCIMINKVSLPAALAAWLNPLSSSGPADRRFYLWLVARASVAWTGRETVGYGVMPRFHLWPKIMEQMRLDGTWEHKSQHLRHVEEVW
jgi:glycosyltransferase involved in cell wall biosynthesis